MTGAGSSQTSIIRVGDDFEYDIAGRATKYFSVDGVRIAVLATTYTASSASVPPAVSRFVRRLELLGPPLAAGFLLLGLVSLASIATRKRPPVWLSAPGVSVLSLVLVAMPYQAYAATPGSGGPGKFGRPAEPFLAYIPDHLGSVRAVVNQNGVVVETRDYDPFGADIAHLGAFSTQHRFTGHPADDPAGGLYNYGARFYNPKWGRFISPDEVTQGFDSQGLNPYAYVLNRPTAMIDPDGREGVAAGGATAVGAAVPWVLTVHHGQAKAAPDGFDVVASGVAVTAGAVLIVATLPVDATLAAALTVGAAIIGLVGGVALEIVDVVNYYSLPTGPAGAYGSSPSGGGPAYDPPHPSPSPKPSPPPAPPAPPQQRERHVEIKADDSSVTPPSTGISFFSPFNSAFGPIM